MGLPVPDHHSICPELNLLIPPEQNSWVRHWSRLRVRVQCRQIHVPTQIPRVGAKNVLCLTVQMRIVVAGFGGSVLTVRDRRFTRMISSSLFCIQSDFGTQSDHIVCYVFAFYTYIFTFIMKDTCSLISREFHTSNLG